MDFSRPKKKSPGRSSLLVAIAVVVLVSASRADSNIPPEVEFSETRFDFGSVPEDFKVHHRYTMINRGFKPLRVKRASSTCDCTRLYWSDSIADPGDTIIYDIWFDTKNYYGSTTRSVLIELAAPVETDISLLYHGLVAQWPMGLRPQPISVMMLPNKDSASVTIRNRTNGQIEARLHTVADTTFTVDVSKAKAGSDRDLEFVVHKHPKLAPGTHRSNFTVAIESAGSKEPILITIPVKLVQF